MLPTRPAVTPARRNRPGRRPHGDAPYRHAEHPRGNRLPDEPEGAGPPDGRAELRHRAAAPRTPHQDSRNRGRKGDFGLESGALAAERKEYRVEGADGIGDFRAARNADAQDRRLELRVDERSCAVDVEQRVVFAAMPRLGDERVYYPLQPQRVPEHVLHGHLAPFVPAVAQEVDDDAEEVPAVVEKREDGHAELPELRVRALPRRLHLAVRLGDARGRFVDGLVEYGELVLEVGVEKRARDVAFARDHAEVHVGKAVLGEELKALRPDFAPPPLVVDRLRHPSGGRQNM